MEMLTQLRQNRRIIQDFTATTLSAIPGMFARLAYLSSLRDLSSGAHDHAGLEVIYPKEAVRQALEQCHEELFARILEVPLEAQLEDLQSCLQTMQGGLCSAVEHWQRLETYRVLLPEHAPDYLKKLFCSNLQALLAILQADCQGSRTVA